MRKLILMGRSGSGKTTLTQALKGERIHYHKTQYINYHDWIIDTPGEYAESPKLGKALALYTYEADVVGILVSATEQYCLFPPCVTAQTNRETVGIVTHTDVEEARTELAKLWLRNAGCKKIFCVSSITGEGVDDILDYLSE